MISQITSTKACHCKFILPPETSHAHSIHSSQAPAQDTTNTSDYHHHLIHHAEHPRPLTRHEPLSHVTTRILILANILTPLLPYSGFSSASLSHEICRFEIWTMAVGLFEYPPRYEKLEDPLRAFAAWMPHFVYVALGHFEGVLREVVGRLEGEREKVKEQEQDSEDTGAGTATGPSEPDPTDYITRSLEDVRLDSFSEILEIMTRANDDLVSVESAIRKPWAE
ncbi:uncharacterized protein BDV14DRAFT_205138 [Aspergillus stella-maris]|uniref:uncharacterized protein n=1 Tax=Aspergillus stella-maris TaxID=1810926 RepID=UPI003CCE3A62